MVLSLLKAEDC